MADIHFFNEKKFLFFYPHTLTFYRNRLTDSDKECEGKFLPSHHPHTLMDKSCCNRMKNELLIRL